jgi:hypothetical protein
MANAAVRSVAGQAGLDEFDAAHRYARGWLVESGKAFSTILTPASCRAASPGDGPRDSAWCLSASLRKRMGGAPPLAEVEDSGYPAVPQLEGRGWPGR